MPQDIKVTKKSVAFEADAKKPPKKGHPQNPKGRKPALKGKFVRKPLLAHHGRDIGVIASLLSSLKMGEDKTQEKTNLLSSFRGTFGENPCGSKKELVMEYVDFFDIDPTDTSAFPYNQYHFNPNYNNLVEPANLNPKLNASRVERFVLWALPQFAVSTAQSSVVVEFGVPVVSFSFYDPSDEDSALMNACAGQQGTLLTPTSVSDWVKVGEWNYKDLFGESNFNPMFSKAGAQVMCTFVTAKPDSGEASDLPIQFMAEITVAQTLAPMSEIEIGMPVSNSPGTWSSVTTSSLGKTPAFVRMKCLRNTM